MNIEQSLIKTLGFGAEDFIKKAVEGGYELSKYSPVYCKSGDEFAKPMEGVLLDPLSWKAVFPENRWSRDTHLSLGEQKVYAGVEHRWQYEMHRFVSALIETV